MDNSAELAGKPQQHIVQIANDGDMVVMVEHTAGDFVHSTSLKLPSATLRLKSRYFDRLLQNDRFGEGVHVHQRHAALTKQYPTPGLIPLDELPVLRVEHLGRISSVKSIEPLLSDFFTILLDHELHTIPPVVNLANLAIVADRFDALDAVRQYIRRKKTIKAIEGKTTPKQETALTEEKMRQRLLVGLMLDHGAWVEKYSARLITKGLMLREISEADALWWDLPGRVEEELSSRRAYALDTIQALQAHFLEAYSTRARQCRLGYDSSAECDSFQFGEMVRFFMKISTLRLQGRLLSTDETSFEYEGDLFLLIERLKQIPEYQVDRNHSHCGIRTRLIPLLDLIASNLQGIGICGECWLENWTKHAWIELKRPLSWTRDRHTGNGAIAGHERRHDLVRSLFLAVDRVWT
ncbi:hypothetical protein AMS68_001788 [Peltaster fructicola]|uniref:BTB domain-containing protein n=1 Tax=Peltaster fructicola TaxID=286661 RepID=A0A6H0XNP2_9PEZI|nr:hypothetical protein AMS68_001788 [Peltaster fructicola]